MSNVYKMSSYRTCPEEQVRVIDYNELISKKIESIRETLNSNSGEYNEDGFTLGLKAENVEVLLDEPEELAMTQETAEAVAATILEEAKREAERITNMAEGNAAEILRKAGEERQQILQSASEEGFKEGYQDAVQQCREKYEQKQIDLETQYQEKMEELQRQKEEMEPVLVETILELFSNMTKLLAKDKKDLILTVVNNTLEGLDVSKNYIIRASKEEAAFLRENKEQLLTCGDDISIEIVEDINLKRGQCMIDTDIGIFDCGLDIQIEGLMDDIKIISCGGKGSR